jgi:predicted RNA binding protein YcfA (HicA-like mRNA interferase family)
MQNISTREFQGKLAQNGYLPKRHNGSHTIYEAERTIIDCISIPTSNKTINGCMAKRLEKQMNDFLRR